VYEQGTGLCTGDVPGLEPGIGAADPEDRGLLSFCQFRVPLDIVLKRCFPELFVAFEQFVDHEMLLYGLHTPQRTAGPIRYIPAGGANRLNFSDYSVI
jgi:hypothetical protein